ncbi:hypothetical protein C8J56DRAFT_943791 [Mycena floridula]|nr:hypothetical protein C8J56DRAFT_943791 [Mycena floridula]
MDEDDDLFDDDICFDDETLAALDNVENSFFESERAAKRQKIDEQSFIEIPSQKLETLELPEFSLPVNQIPRNVLGPANGRQQQQQPRTPPSRIVREPSRRPPAPAARPAPAPQPVRPTPIPAPAPQNEALEELRRRLEQVSRENAEMQARLKAAEDTKLAKEGEVTFLRKTMEKNNKEHAAQVAKFKLEKEELDLSKAQLQKNMKEEVERLKTQFMFKQHEVESSARKAPMSARSKRTTTFAPPPTPSRPWNMQNLADPSFSQLETPLRPRKSPSKNHRIPKVESPEKLRKSAILPGFHNAFADPGPVRWKGKEKEKEQEQDPFGSQKLNNPSQPQGLFPSQFAILQPCRSPPSSPSRPRLPRRRQPSEDIFMQDDLDVGLPFVGSSSPALPPRDTDPDDVFDEEDEDMVQPVDWQHELCRILLTHSPQSSSTSTLQTLIGTTLTDAYSSELAGILQAIASPEDYDAVATHISRRLVTLSRILYETNTITTLGAMLDLLVALGKTLPGFTSTLLSQGLMDVLCEVVQTKLDKGQEVLLKETIEVLESVCWNVSDEAVDRLARLASDGKTLTILFDASQPLWFLIRATRFLALLVTHAKLAKFLLCLPNVVEAQAEDPAITHIPKLPYIERICALLIDTRPESMEMKTSILTFIATLSMSHPEAMAILTASHVLIPSLVLYLTHLTTPLWEDNPDLMENPELIVSTIRTMDQTLFLLHHLVLRSEQVDLVYKLHHAPHRPFIGITHMFTVTLGWLSYADPPDWVDVQARRNIVMMREMARDLLDLVVDGPEADGVWAAYQDDSQSENNLDDDMEEQLLGNSSD